MKQKSLRARMQAFGGFLTAMVIPNMGAFIAWGFLTALFIDTGWMPNKAFSQIVSPMSKYLLPMLISFMGGKLVGGDRGGVAGTIGTIGLIIGADIPMFLGAMIMGPLSAWVIKKFDEFIEDKAPAGFEMIINNFSLGIIGLILCLLSYSFIGPAIVQANNFLTTVIQAIVKTGALPALAILNEPAKVLFLNNVIDQGIYYPLGMQQSLAVGKSIFFMVASNPGAGLGLLLAYSVFGKGQAKKTAPGAIIIHFFGGIHEIYFPYVLMKPITILGMIAGVFVATVVSFVINGLLIRASKDVDDEELMKSQEKSKAMKQEGKDILEGAKEQVTASTEDINKVVFACDAGLGSSAMGATSFRKRLEKAGIKMDVKNYAIEKVPQDVNVIVTHENLLERAEAANPGIRIVTIQNFLKDQNIEDLYEEIVQKKQK